MLPEGEGGAVSLIVVRPGCRVLFCFFNLTLCKSFFCFFFNATLNYYYNFICKWQHLHSLWKVLRKLREKASPAA